MAEFAVSTVLANVGNLAVQGTSFVCAVTFEVAVLKDELMRMQAYLKDAESKRRSGNARVAVLVSQIRDAAYEAENAIAAAEYMKKRNMIKKGFKAAVSRYARLPGDLTTLRKVGVKIQRVRRKLNEIFQSVERLNIDLDIQDVDECLEDYDLAHQNFKDDFVMVGFENEYREIVNKLVQGGNMLSAISIVAMGGAGKTTVARKVYTASGVKQHFEVLVWVTVSEKFKVIDLLKEIVKQIPSDVGLSINDEMNEYEVGKKIHDILIKKRYLVVLDDVWETDTWEQINRTIKAFPDAANFSRVLLTTRKEDVANHVEMPTHVHSLRCLDEEKSWELLSSKALPSYKRSNIHDLDKFENLGRKLTKKCDGLPLALAVLGGYLSKNLNTQAWSDVLLGWPSTKDTQMMWGIIARSYKDLPNHYLRSCFLYLAAFPEDFIISVSDLINLWIAESLIPHTPKHILEETARKYVTELTQRSLVQVVETNDIYGWIEKIKIHDILRDWCIEEATQDGFLDVIDETTRGQDGAPSSYNLISYRSSFQNSSEQILQASPNLRALFGFGLLSISFPKLRFLRVLHVENARLENSSEVIGGCVHLRHLGLRRCRNVVIPSSVRKLLYLQTIDLAGVFRHESEVSNSLWDIPTLRYIDIPRISLPRSVQFQKSLRELHMFASIYEIEKDPMPILEMLPCLVMLGLNGFKAETMSFKAQGFPRLQELTLEMCSINWRMEVGAMPKLFHLSFKRCPQMDGIPKGLLHLPSLRSVSLRDLRKYYLSDKTVKGLKQKGCEVKESRTPF
ncbi:Disease resistance RPP8-like protein 3 [Triticum urartu]|uniref:Disease resistance RPP8-like protein 3 n=2 Tax=Triticum urartu TaxID=4572 RepID=M7ZWB2_TRIUA|nr:putative disease resistance protein At1g50180 [Triticum urartu]XP_048550600.1 putative disease resistance protein At1g50180 [Triticum urartu]XP_048550602.1 putative disease resistance protein At1g50180 [Triticum urartu]EMS52419.1 Disease resistance RPP8-like protein 3 [Triticum urartu]